MNAKRFLAASIACASVTATSAVMAEGMPERYFYFGGHISENWIDLGDHYEPDNGSYDNEVTLPGAQLGYRFNRDWSVQAWWERNNSNTDLFGDVDLNIASAALRKHFYGSSSFEPYVGIGAGEFRAEPSSDSSFDYQETIGTLEAGFQTLLHPHFILDVGARPYYAFDSERWDAEIYAGLNFLIGATNSGDDEEEEQEEQPAQVDNVVSDSDSDGVPDEQDQCSGTPAGAQVDATGCELDDDGDGVANSKDKCADTPAGALVNETGCQQYLDKDVKETLYVEFEHGKAEVTKASYPKLGNLAGQMRKYPSANLVLEGHTDSTGSAAFNKKLSKERADAVMRVLVDEYEIDAGRVSTEGYGEEKPIADNGTAEGRAQNRRVEAVMKATTKEAQFQ
ncbi:OmpA family protein [Alcanivorax sediminis]|uniref:OmpA family protein n=1 Tax=Alcanivorax sediminis TaxID=2663008 RepID=A0A6N7LVF7_9GAMM|nr:OmpA family protein [Alcanivorax sediminis]MQX53376.1 OmpA family protein [Alcanivorax sediminis]